MTQPQKTICQLAVERLTGDIARNQIILNRLNPSIASFADAEERLTKMKHALASLLRERG